MVLLDRLLPAWRHSDPGVRAAAVRNLGKDAGDILASVARNDRDARVRGIAIKKIDDAGLLLEIASRDSDEEVRALAGARAEELLVERALSHRPPEECERALAGVIRPHHKVTVALRAFHPSIRRAALSGLSEERPLAEIARRSDDPQIGLEALARVSDVTLLHRVAAAESCPEVALAALARIEAPELLQAIAEDPQSQKSVRKRARAVLERVLTDDHPLRIAERHRRQLELCASVEQLGEVVDPAATRAALRQAEADWQELSTRAAPEPQVEERFRRACHALREAVVRVEDRRAAEQQREAARLQAYAARQQLCETVEALEGADTPKRLADARAAWLALPDSDDPRLELAARFTLAAERCEQRYERWQVRGAFHSRVEALVIEAERLVEAGDPRAAVRPRAGLEKRWAQLEASPEGTKWLVNERALQRRFVEAGEALRNQEHALRAQHQQREREARAQLKVLCGRLEQLARAETLRRAVADRALAAASEALQHFPPVPASERNALQQRLTAAQHALAQRLEAQAIADGWQRWANADVQQQLIEAAEALLAADDPKQMLREIGRFDREWKRFAVAPREQSHALWERFRRARDELRRRCDAYLSENLTKKEALCAAVERLAESTDWNATAAAIQRLQAEWKQIGPVRAPLSEPLFERFRTPANRFFERRQQFLLARAQQREERLERLRRLCAAAEALAESTDWEASAAAVKRLQAEAQEAWGRRRPPGAPPEGKPSHADILRHQFQAACDRFFERYRRRDQIELEGQLAAAEAVLGDLEALHASLAGPEAPPAEHVARRLKDRLAEWRRFGPLPPSGRLHERLQACCDAIEAACRDGLPEEELAAESNVPQREKLCTKIDRLLSAVDAPLPSDLGERLKLALAANTIGGPAATRREQAMQETLETAQRLREKWQRLGPVIGRRARGLAVRFDTAVAEIEQRRGTAASVPKPPPRA